MPRLRVEIRDFAELVRRLANLRSPLHAQHVTYRKWFFRFNLDVTLHELDEVRAAGPVVIETEVDVDATRLQLNAWIPALYVKSSYSVSGGGILVRDRTRSLEIDIVGGLMGDIQLTESETGAATCAAKLDLRGFHFQFHVFPAWLERQLQRPIERVLGNALAQMIGDAVLSKRPLVAADQRGPELQTASALPQADPETSAPRPRGLASLAYNSSYYVAYGLVFPVLWVASAVPAKNSAVEGLRDGAAAAKSGVQRLKARGTRPSDHVSTGAAEMAAATA